MSPAASTQGTATAVPAADCEPGSPPPAGDLQRPANPPSADGTSGPPPAAAGAARTAIAPNVAQSMCTEGLLFWGSGGQIGGRGPGQVVDRQGGDGGPRDRGGAGAGPGSSPGRSLTLAAVTALRRDAT